MLPRERQPSQPSSTSQGIHMPPTLYCGITCYICIYEYGRATCHGFETTAAGVLLRDQDILRGIAPPRGEENTETNRNPCRISVGRIRRLFPRRGQDMASPREKTLLHVCYEAPRCGTVHHHQRSQIGEGELITVHFLMNWSRRGGIRKWLYYIE